MQSSRSLVARSLLVVAPLLVALAGCSAKKASVTALEPHAAAPKATDGVEVLLDREPERPFKVVGELKAKTLESPMSIDLMRAEAARAGYDGIYWIECASARSGQCTAKGYVYSAPVKDPGLPEPSETVARK